MFIGSLVCCEKKKQDLPRPYSDKAFTVTLLGHELITLKLPNLLT